MLKIKHKNIKKVYKKLGSVLKINYVCENKLVKNGRIKI